MDNEIEYFTGEVSKTGDKLVVVIPLHLRERVFKHRDLVKVIKLNK